MINFVLMGALIGINIGKISFELEFYLWMAFISWNLLVLHVNNMKESTLGGIYGYLLSELKSMEKKLINELSNN